MKTNAHSSIEALESRIAPAAILILTDVDGDVVTIKTSKGTNADLAAAGVVVTSMPGGSVNNGVQIDTINLTNPVFDGTDLSVTAKASPRGGDGLVNVVRINATSADLGVVTVKGDLQEIDAGKVGGSIAAINVNSTSGTRVSNLAGSLGTWSVKTDLRGMEIHLDDAGATLGLLKIGGSLIGEAGFRTGHVSVANGTITKVSIGGDIRGGTSSADSGVIIAKSIGAVTIGGSILGGAGPNGGRITVSTSLGSLLVKGDVIGGTAANTGLIQGDATLGNITINGSLVGGAAGHSGAIEGVSGIGTVKIGRDQQGGAATDAGNIQSTAGKIAAVTIGGSVIGGSANFSGRIFADNGIGPVKIGGDLISIARDSAGTLITDSGTLYAGGAGLSIASVKIGGSIVGGSSQIQSQIYGLDKLGPIKIGRDVLGSVGPASGSIGSSNGIASVDIGGSLVGSTGFRSGNIQAFFAFVGPVKIGGSVVGGSGLESGRIRAAFLGNVTIGGDLIAGSVADTGAIFAGLGAGAIKIGNIVGNPTVNATISVNPPVGGAQLAIKSLTVAGRVEFAQITAGIGTANPDVQIGPVKVGGDWTASNLLTGVDDGADNLFGTADDVAVVGGDPALFSKIASITIGGRVAGTAGGNDHFGFVSQEIGSMKVNGVKIPLAAGRSNDTDANKDQFILGTTVSTINAFVRRDVTVHEIA